MFKKIIALMCVFLFFVFSVSVSAENQEMPKITAAAYVLYNPDNDEIVESKNSNNTMYPASLTKMMTALAVTDLCKDLDNEKITVTEAALKSLYGTGSSTANIKKGEIFTVRQLLYLMLLPSGNDAANALAEHFTDNRQNFVEYMNQKAELLGMKNTNFANPHGLHDPNHYSTAEDLAILADAYMNVPVLYDIAQCNEYKVPKTNIQDERDIRSTNFMKIENSGYYYKYATGLKTGYTLDAGRCFAGSAEKDGKKYICIFLNTPEVWNRYGLVRTEFLEAAELFEYAFNTYHCVKIADSHTKVASVPVFETFNKNVNLVLKQDVFATLPKGTDLSKIEINFSVNDLIDSKYVDSPLKKGDSFGKAKLVIQEKIVGECEVIAENSVNPSGLIVFWHKIDFYFYLVLIILGLFVLLLTVFAIRKKIVLYRRRKLREKRELHRQKLREAFLKNEPYDYFKME